MVRSIRKTAGWKLAAPGLRVVACCGLLLAVSACVPPDTTNHDFSSLMQTYRTENARLANATEERLTEGINVLAVVPDNRGRPRVSLDLTNAHLGQVIDRVLRSAGVGFVNKVSPLNGRITARFKQRPLLPALNLLLNGNGMHARMDGDVIVIDRGLTQGDLSEEEIQIGPKSANYNLSYITAESAQEMLEGLYSGGDVTFTKHPALNSVLISGSSESVKEAVDVLRSIDVTPPHVFFEALIVEFSVEAFLELGSRLENGASGELSNLFFDIANLVGDTVAFTYTAGASAATSFSVVLNYLIQEDKARVLSRPYVSTVSGKLARLEITEDRFVQVNSVNGLDVELQEVSSGIVVETTPIATDDDKIIMNFSVAESRFIPSLENISLRRSKNSVTSTAQVVSGETVIVGGLMLKTRSESIAGLPGLRDIPIVEYVLGHRDTSWVNSQVMIFLTPQIWRPGIDAPVKRKDLFVNKEYEEKGFSAGRTPAQPEKNARLTDDY